MKYTGTIDMNELESMASDTSVEVPHGLRSDLEKSLDLLEYMSSEEEPASTARPAGWLYRWRGYIAGAAAAAAIAIVTGLSLRSTPKDTFSDPYLAYAQLQEAFELISTKMDKGMEMARSATDQVMTMTTDMIDNI